MRCIAHCGTWKPWLRAAAAALRWAQGRVQGRVQGTPGTPGGTCMCASQEAAFATLAAQPSWQQSVPKPIRNGRRTATVTSVPYLGVLAAVLAAAEMCTSQRGRRQCEATLLAVLVMAVTGPCRLGAVLLRALYNRVLRGANCNRRRRRNLTSGTGQQTNKQTLWPKPERVFG